MKVIKTDEIIIPADRIRKEFDEIAIEELAVSIYRVGLLQPITCRPAANGLTTELVAGENRLRAVQLLYDCGLEFDCDRQAISLGYIPFIMLSSDETADAYEAELDENLKRKDLTWQEKTLAIARLHELRTAEHGEYQNPEKGWSLSDTANEIAFRKKGRDKASGGDRDFVRHSVFLAQHMDDPLVMHAKSERDAMKIIRGNIKHERRKQKKEEFEAKKAEETRVDLEDLVTDENSETIETLTSNIHQHEGHTLIHGDFFEQISLLPSDYFDVICSDPPYGINIHKLKLWDGESHDYDDSEETFDKLIDILATEGYRITAEEAHAYVFCDIRRWERIFVFFEVAGWKCWPRPIIWDKGNTGSFGDPEHGPRACYDAILYAIKGGKQVTEMYRDVINITQPTIGNGHPASKPVELYKDLLRRSVYPGDRVIDPLCGSGPIFPAAHELDCIATGIEKEEKYHLMSLERMIEL